jgi:predicted nucleotidyltransferase
MAGKSILNDTPKNLLDKFYLKLLADKIKVEKLILFGSYAKGKQKFWSDLDVCVVSRQFGKEPYEEMIYLKNIASDIEPMIEPHPYSPKDLEDKWDPLADQIRKYGKVWPKPAKI